MMYAKMRSTGQFKAVECGDAGEVYMLLCGLTASGEVKPLRVDDDGKIILST
jgi:hypothetical protein